MWIISGPFDGRESGEVGFQKAKLLKTGTKYVVGRKQRQLVVNHKKISHDHAEFIVGAYTLDDVNNPSSLPKLEVFNSKSKALKVLRGSMSLVVNPLATQELQDSDALEIVSSPEITLSVQWSKLCFYTPASRGQSQSFLDACAQLGINVVTTLDSRVTHHLAEALTPSCCFAHSLLLATQFVRPDWLGEIIRLGNLSMEHDTPNGTSLESLFALPPIAKYRPALPHSLPPSLKAVNVWEPNEERLNMFIGHRFVIIGGAKGINPEVREMIAAGGGEYEEFAANGGKLKLHQVLAKGMRRISEMPERGKSLVVVADGELVKDSVGPELWKELIDEMQSFQLRCISIEGIIQSVIAVDLSCFTPSCIEAPKPLSAALDYSPNTYPLEASIPPDSQISRAVDDSFHEALSRAPPKNISVEILKESASEQSDVPVRKLLKRRAKAEKHVIIGIDDPSAIIDTEHEKHGSLSSVLGTTESSAVVDSNVSVPSRSSRLKRRMGTAASAAGPQLSFNTEETEGEPPLKKYRALFEASDPHRIANDGLENYGTSGTSLTQDSSRNHTGLMTSGGHVPASAASAESEGSAMASSTDIRPTKRKADALASDDPDTRTPSGEAPSTNSNAKKRTADDPSRSVIEDPNTALESGLHLKRSAKKVKLDIATTQPDKDEAFLKALASTKKGKKLEDTFDREFNNLKISKPELAGEEQEKWSLLADFDNERDMRGNFMVIVEMDVFKNQESRPTASVGPRLDWPVRDNFKKFKKRVHTQSRATIELVVREEDDFGTGSAYWREKNSQSQHVFSGTSQLPGSSGRDIQSYDLRPSETRHLDEVEKGTSAKPSIPHSHARRKPSTSAKNAKVSQSNNDHAESRSLFLDSDGEDQSQDHIHGNDEILTLHPAGGTTSSKLRSSRKTKVKTATAAVIIDDDSDDAATFKGFRRKRDRGT